MKTKINKMKTESTNQMKKEIREYCKNHGMQYEASLDMLMIQIERFELAVRTEQRQEDYETFVKNR